MSKHKVLPYVLFSIYILLILLEYKQFSIWSQVGYYLFNSESYDRLDMVLELFQDKHPHALRILLIYPFFEISDFLGVDVNFLYNIVLVILVFTIYKIFISITKGMIHKPQLLLVLFFIIFLSLYMNGRLIFAILGNTFILYILYRQAYSEYKLSIFKVMIYILLSLWLCSVSSGTLMVGIGTILLFYFLNFIVYLPYIKKTHIYFVLIILAFLLFFLPLILQLINKNLDYYDGSFFLMLDHGFGKYFTNIIIYLILSLPLIFLSMIIAYKYLKKYSYYILPLSMIFSSLTIGLFGTSSLVSGIMAYILFIYMILYGRSNV
ncbi:MAG: hypothetical protein Q9M36_10680 [Sulfurovum sp.]|nr:hypothetical protein [Sulfurovum sp.]